MTEGERPGATASRIVTLDPSTVRATEAVGSLEGGDVLFLRNTPFVPAPAEAALFTPAAIGSGKNISYDPASGRVGGSVLTGAPAEQLQRMLARFSDQALTLVGALFPGYRDRLKRARASYRPVEIAGRASSWRKDDTRLHIDSFPASPVAGDRILRVFTNVNPEGRPRSWRIGEDFESAGRYFAPQLKVPLPGMAAVLRAVGVTKTLRTPYDALMLQLHDCMKADSSYQVRALQTAFDFPPGTTWIAFTDQVSHAAMAGQYQLEQTFLLPVAAMADPRRSPLRVLERLKGRRLV